MGDTARVLGRAADQAFLRPARRYLRGLRRGLLLGVLAGVLLAPWPGSETRAKVMAAWVRLRGLWLATRSLLPLRR